MPYFAQVDEQNELTVLRVVVCDTVQYLLDRLGGFWSETLIGDPVEKYAGIGYHDVAYSPDRFLVDWRQPESAQEGYAKGAWSWHNGGPWRSNHPNNTSTPGAANWRDYLEEWPQWNNAGEPYQPGDKVTQSGNHYINTLDDNTAPPQQPGSGWEEQLSPITTPKGKP